MKIFIVAGARPNFMKIAPIIRALENRNQPGMEWQLVHTGQHYDFNMSETFFEDLGIPKPDFFLNSGSGSHATQTAKIMQSFEVICLSHKPDIVVVVGDVNSTLACSIVAKKIGIKVAHVEAGLRSRDLSMPEEINRIVTDSITDYFFVTEESGKKNLIQEGKSPSQIFFIGHVMIDNLYYQLDELTDSFVHQFGTCKLKEGLTQYVFLTLHRPANVDHEASLNEIAKALNLIAEEIPVLFPVHPRTQDALKKFKIKLHDAIHQLAPLSFKESLFLWKDAIMVLTDSGGLQEETTALGVPCITLRENTERPITLELGTNVLAGNRSADILENYRNILRNPKKNWTKPPLWDGHAAERLVDILVDSKVV
jgi:UDP-N-acetylglucosamine 2-epimerase (non-hydrolysing)